MLSSISGQNEQWARLAAYQPPPISQSGQNGGWGSMNGTTASSGATPPMAGGISGALSDGMSFALMALGGGWGGGATASSQAAGQSSGTTAASSLDSDGDGDGSGQTGATQAASSPGSQLFTDLRSLLSALAGNGGSSTGSGATSAAATTSGGTGTIAATASGLSSTVLQDLQSIGSDLNTLASASGTTQPGGVGGNPPGPPPWSNDTSTTGNGTGSTGGWSPSSNDGFQTQFALAAYNASTMPGPGSQARSPLASINA